MESESTVAAFPFAESEATRPQEEALSIVVLYQDRVTQEWAERVCRHATQLLGAESVHAGWWKLSFLSDPWLLAQTVRKAAAADLVVISVYGGQEPSPELARWCERLLEERPRHEGALVALVGLPGQPSAPSSVMVDYLRTVAERAGLDFLPQELKCHEALSDHSLPRGVDRATATTELLRDILDREQRAQRIQAAPAQERESTPRWGIND